MEGEPEPDAGLARRGVEEARVLMRRRLAADPRILEDVHRLRQHRVAPAELLQQAGEARRLCVAAEGGVEEVQAVADLVERIQLVQPLRQPCGSAAVSY